MYRAVSWTSTDSFIWFASKWTLGSKPVHWLCLKKKLSKKALSKMVVCKLAISFRPRSVEKSVHRCLYYLTECVADWCSSDDMCLMVYCSNSFFRLVLVGTIYQLCFYNFLNPLYYVELFCRDMSMCHRTAFLFVVYLLYCTDLSWKVLWKAKYGQASNTRCALVGNKIASHPDVVGASPIGTASTKSSFST